MDRKTFPGLDPLLFQHPWDIAAMSTLKQAKGFDILMSKILEYGIERLYMVENVASNIEVSPEQCEGIYAALCEACRILDMPVPKMYIDMNPVPNAFTIGHRSPCIIVHHSLIDLLSEEELLFVIGHELGHIKCEHVLYNMVAMNIQTILQIPGDVTLGLGRLIGQGLFFLLLDWRRKAELSADRAGLLVVQDVGVGIRVMMKLAGGSSPRIASQLSEQIFLRQADAFYELDKDSLSKLYKFVQVINQDHPWPVLRARELKEWSKDGYARLVGVSTLMQNCPWCGAASRVGAAFCTQCGGRLNSAQGLA